MNTDDLLTGFSFRPTALAVTQPEVSKHWRHMPNWQHLVS